MKEKCLCDHPANWIKHYPLEGVKYACNECLTKVSMDGDGWERTDAGIIRSEETKYTDGNQMLDDLEKESAEIRRLLNDLRDVEPDTTALKGNNERL